MKKFKVFGFGGCGKNSISSYIEAWGSACSESEEYFAMNSFQSQESKPIPKPATLIELENLLPELINIELEKLFLSASKVLCVAGLGGKAGTKCITQAVLVAQWLNIPCSCLLAVPFSFEGVKRKKIAEDTISALEETGAKVLIYRNDALLNNKYDENTSLSEILKDLGKVNLKDLIDQELKNDK